MLDPAGACKFDDFVDSNPYTDKKTRGEKEGVCGEIMRAVDKEDHSTAEGLINQLQASLYADYASCVGPPFGTAGTCVLAAVGLQETVAAFSQAICDLDTALPQPPGLGSDCLPATVATLALNDGGGTNPIWGGWKAFGPVGEVSPANDLADAIVLPNGEIGIMLDALEPDQVFGTIRENPPASELGPCPENAESEKNCEPPSYAINLDTPGDHLNNDPIAGEGLYVEMCEEVFATGEPGRGADGEFDADDVTAVDPARGVLGCSRGGTAFAPSTWSILSEADAVRTVHVIVNSHSAAVSEGTVVKVFGPAPSTAQAGTCTTVESGPNESTCDITGLDSAPGTLQYSLTAEKVVGSGSHSGTATFSLSAGDPSLGPPENGVKTVTVDVGP
ncbi:MAG: hypothetical protein ACREMK_00660 [Gemmatimonadota bacterium]